MGDGFPGMGLPEVHEVATTTGAPNRQNQPQRNKTNKHKQTNKQRHPKTHTRRHQDTCKQANILESRVVLLWSLESCSYDAEPDWQPRLFMRVMSSLWPGWARGGGNKDPVW